MSNHTSKLFKSFTYLIFLILISFINWVFPLYNWFGDTPVIRFVWLGIFFIILDFVIEVIIRSVGEVRLMMEASGFAKDIHKMSEGFHVASKYVLSNNLRVDHIVVGSSGVWLITVKDGGGKVTFNGDELLQDNVVLAGLISQSLEKAYALAGFIKEKLNREVKVAPVIAFSSPSADLSEMPKSVRGVFVSSYKDTVSLIENTDFQLIDKNSIEGIGALIKK